MLRIEACLPLHGSDIDAYFGRTDNYLMASNGLLETLTRQLESHGIPLISATGQNPFIQVFKNGGALSREIPWRIQYTIWIPSNSSLSLGEIQSRCTESVIQSLISSGINRTREQLRAALNDDRNCGTLKFVNGQNNFTARPPPPDSVSWHYTDGLSEFTQPPPDPVVTPNGGGSTPVVTPGTDGRHPVATPDGSNDQRPRATKATSIALPIIATIAVLGVVWYVKNQEE